MSVSNTYGRKVTATFGYPIMVAAEGIGRMDWKTGGVTLDWTVIPAVAAATTLTDGTIIPAGQSGLRYGTILTKITASGKYGPWTAAAGAATTVASGGTVLGVYSLTLTSAAGIFPGDLLLVDTAGQAETLVVASVAGNVVTFTTPTTKTHANAVAAVKTDDGRATLAAGSVFILNMSLLQTMPGGVGVLASDNPAVLYGGSVWSQRLLVGGTNQPTLAALLAAMPRIQPIDV